MGFAATPTTLLRQILEQLRIGNTVRQQLLDEQRQTNRFLWELVQKGR
jgi:hypothetical protein